MKTRIKNTKAHVLKGLNPDKNTGKCFQADTHVWYPLWEYVYHTCDIFLSEIQIRDIVRNDGKAVIQIDKGTAQRVGYRLEKLLTEGQTKKYEEDFKESIRKLPDEYCGFCQGIGKRNPGKGLPVKCFACAGRGMKKNIMSRLRFNTKGVQNFAEFLIHSGGVEIL